MRVVGWLLLCFLMANSQAWSQAAESEAGKDKELLNEGKLEYLRNVVAELESSTKATDLAQSLIRLRGGFPESRVVLHEALRSRSPKMRAFALRILGEEGEAELDMELIAQRLLDPVDKVRLAAVMALRQFGANADPYIIRYLPGEVNFNNRKMAVKSLKYSDDMFSVIFLTDMLKREKHPRVKPFIVDALESLSGRRYGSDIGEWERHAQALILVQREAELEERRGKTP